MSEVIREFLVQGSEPSPYKVVFKKMAMIWQLPAVAVRELTAFCANTVSRFSMATMGLLWAKIPIKSLKSLRGLKVAP